MKNAIKSREGRSRTDTGQTMFMLVKAHRVVVVLRLLHVSMYLALDSEILDKLHS